jgi:hypothetical protein
MRKGLDCWATASAASMMSSGTIKNRSCFGFEATAPGQAERARFRGFSQGTLGENGFFITSQWSWNWPRLCATRPDRVIKQFSVGVTKILIPLMQGLETTVGCR